ncbi:stage III sporulation protein AB [uncultured Tyzzerella sp.]|uniref:stage III sporulation protein AB n=1 Tax=uncultured Tyzzerella sp. TaxID=2321398 RepID=UPI0029423668|nr:stage III sporulation protein AB [uncultured Tyzzerella sp.]
MYLKIILSIVILIGFSIIGIYYSYKPIYRKNDLLEMKRALLSLASEITFFSNIDEAILNIEKNLQKPVKNIFKRFRKNLEEKRGEELATLWSDALKNGCYETYFTREDIENINILGKIIGSLDISFNVEGLNIIIDYINSTVEILENEKNKTFKMYQSLGVLSGLMIIILLI